jgi:preprotein translocase subunit SecG
LRKREKIRIGENCQRSKKIDNKDKNMRKTSLIVSILFLVGIIGIVNAQNTQEALPEGGDGFETAVKLEPGSYQRDVMQETGYFYVDVKAGQGINIKYTFSVGTGRDGWGILLLYDENRTKLIDEWDTVSEDELKSIAFSWLSNSEKDSYKYYIKTGYDRYDVGSVSFNLSLTDYYDAGSQTDAGDSPEKAMNITPGEYRAYLSGESGTDTKDFYKLAVRTGQTLAIKITPPMEASMEVIVYDSTRKKLESKSTPNPGAIFTTSVPITKSEDIFVAVVCDDWMSETLVEYVMDITTEGEAVVDEDEDVFAGAGTGVSEDAAEKKGLNWWLIIGIIALVIILALATVAYFLLKKRKNSNKEQEKVEDEKIIK